MPVKDLATCFEVGEDCVEELWGKVSVSVAVSGLRDGFLAVLERDEGYKEAGK